MIPFQGVTFRFHMTYIAFVVFFMLTIFRHNVLLLPLLAIAAGCGQ